MQRLTEPKAKPAARSHLTRVVHLALLLTVIHQLVGSEFMELPFPGDPPSLIFSLHEYLGLVGFGLATIFWGWMVIRRGETRLSRLLPWASPARLRDVWDDVAAHFHDLAQGHFPDEGNGALASAVHGLGLLAVTAMAGTGFAYFLTQGTHLGRDTLDLHKLFANLVWAYLFGHAGLAALHHFLGGDGLASMFWFGGRRLEARARKERETSAAGGPGYRAYFGALSRQSPTEAADGLAGLCLTRAALCRASAARECDPSRRQALNGLAEKWERLAVDLD